MFSPKNKKMPNERIIYEARPNMIFGCKKVVWGIIVFALIMYVSGPIKSAIIGLQTYYISFIKFGIMGYVALAFVVLMLLDILYIVWQLLAWYSTTYTITNERIIIKKGVINTKKTYMPFKSIQDINLSQNIIEKIVNVGSVSAYSAYDNNDVTLAHISNPSEVEDILFKKINEGIYADTDSMDYLQENNYNKEYKQKRHSKKRYNKYSKKHNKHYNHYPNEDYYSQKYESHFNEFEEAYPTNERNNKKGYRYDNYNSQNEYDNYDEEPYDGYHQYHNDNSYDFPEENNYKAKNTYNKYEYEEYPRYNERKQQKYDYEYYNDDLEDNINHAMNDLDNSKYSPRNEYEHDELYYNDDDSDSIEEFYRDNKDEINYYPQEEQIRGKKQKKNNKRKEIVQRHFDKFNR